MMRVIYTLLLLVAVMPIAHAEFRVFACEPEWAALAEELGGDRVQAESAVTGLQDPHYIQARPSLIAKVRRADMVICTGAELEAAWLPLLLRQANNPRVQIGAPGLLIATDYVELLDKPAVIDRGGGDIHPFGNPHIQTDPRNIVKVAEALTESLVQLDPDNAEYYRGRYGDFAMRWTEAVKRWTAEVSPLRGMQIVTHHKSWVYLIDWVGLEEVGTLEPKPGVPPTPRHLAELSKQVEDSDVRLIVRSAYQSDRASHWLSDRTGVEAIVLPQTIGSVEGTGDLFSMFDVMVQRMLEVQP